ncbi:LAQU0S01e01420g1_1 [Lachancea quebecensis]|uniref:Autophagy-related protein 17 n=1 Tax=Lachancea quebecensis TaxID=1654605 RepID=A0A0P1KK61_9SACH|nr:LAQU0S01e01420g1_1 [Lachancea quebecensis]
MNEAVVEKLLENSRKFLTGAKLICQESNDNLTVTKLRIREWQKYQSKLQFVLDCIQQQTNFLSKILLREGIGKNLIDEEWSQTVLVQLVNDMKHWQNEIIKMMDKLDNVTNELDQQNNSKLGDFISRDSSHVLDGKLNEIPTIKKQVENITRQYQMMQAKIQDHLVETRMQSLRNEFDSKFGDQCKENMKLNEEFTNEADQLEQELADFLKSFTDHFDKCYALSSRSVSSEDAQNLFEIVERDDKDLAAINSLLHDAATDVSSFARKVNMLLDEKDTDKAEMQVALSKLLTELRKHEEYISVFEGISALIQKFKASCLEDIRQTRNLLDFYANFEKSYQNLLKEVRRRRETAAKISQILKSCETQLDQINTTDLRERQMFLLENGNYLPETIWPEEIGSLSPLYTLDYEVRKI